MFKANKWEQWYDSLPSHTKEYLKKQAVWHDVDMFKAFLVGICFGILVGFLLWI